MSCVRDQPARKDSISAIEYSSNRHLWHTYVQTISIHLHPSPSHLQKSWKFKHQELTTVDSGHPKGGSIAPTLTDRDTGLGRRSTRHPLQDRWKRGAGRVDVGVPTQELQGQIKTIQAQGTCPAGQAK